MPLLLDTLSVSRTGLKAIVANPELGQSSKKTKRERMVRILDSFLALIVTLLIVFLLGSSFLISSDFKRGDLFNKYRNDRSFLHRIESGANVHIRDEGNRTGPPLILLHGGHKTSWYRWPMVRA